MRPVTFTFVATLAVALLSCTTPERNPAGRAAQTGIKKNSSLLQAKESALRRLESVTWNSVKHELTWDVSKGERKENAYKAVATDHYEIDMDHATMTVNGETRRFSEDEATNVRTLMDLIARYAVESTVWWEDGQGEPIDGSPLKPRGDKNPNQVVAKPLGIEQLARLQMDGDTLRMAR